MHRCILTLTLVTFVKPFSTVRLHMAAKTGCLCKYTAIGCIYFVWIFSTMLLDWRFSYTPLLWHHRLVIKLSNWAILVAVDRVQHMKNNPPLPFCPLLKWKTIMILVGDHAANDDNTQVLQQPSVSLRWSRETPAWSWGGLDCRSQLSSIWTGKKIYVGMSAPLFSNSDDLVKLKSFLLHLLADIDKLLHSTTGWRAGLDLGLLSHLLRTKCIKAR